MWLFTVFLRPPTGKSLCFGNLGWRHLLRNLVSPPGGTPLPLRREKVEPKVKERKDKERHWALPPLLSQLSR